VQGTAGRLRFPLALITEIRFVASTTYRWECDFAGLLNPLLDVSPEDELYHGEGKLIESFDSYLVILVHIPPYRERRLPKDK